MSILEIFENIADCLNPFGILPGDADRQFLFKFHQEIGNLEFLCIQVFPEVRIGREIMDSDTEMIRENGFNF